MAQQTHVLIDSAESVVRDGTVVQGGGTGAAQVASAAANVPRRALGGRARRRARQRRDVHRRAADPRHGHLARAARTKRRWAGGRRREPVHPAFVPLMEPAGLGWLDGFNELLCRCGLESNGPPEFDDAGRLLRPLHGRIANTPAHRVELIVDEDAGQLTLRGVVDESRFHFQSAAADDVDHDARSAPTNSPGRDEVENIGGREATLQMLYHFNIGQPLLRPGARITRADRHGRTAHASRRQGRHRTLEHHAAAATGLGRASLRLGPRGRQAGDTRVLVSGLTDDEAVGLRFNKRALPCLTVWRNTPAEADGYVLGIEPGTNYPNPRTFEKQHGRVVSLKPGESGAAR